MARKDLLSEAIADAKAVKETALANAKLALEEAFTPQLQSMISAKLAEEAEEEEELDMVDDEMESDDAEESELELDMDSEEDMYMDSDDEMEMDSEEELESEEYDEAEEDEMTEEEDDLDLESIIKELEAEMEDDSDVELTDEDELEDVEEEEIDLDEIIRTLKEMEGDDEEEVESDEEVDDVVADLEEAYKTIESLQSTINEVNLLNAKLLYTNKLFRTFDLNEGQKIKVLENFDRTTSVREVKLVFTTLAENLNVVKKKKIVVKEGYASKVTRSSAPKKIISEGNEMAARWKKLAGLK
jgi:hypothetical protein